MERERDNGERKRERRENEEISLHFLSLSPFSHSLSISSPISRSLSISSPFSRRPPAGLPQVLPPCVKCLPKKVLS